MPPYPDISKSILISAPARPVWRALTDATRVPQWFNGAQVTSPWQIGAPIRFTGSLGEHTFDDGGIILALETERILQYSFLSSLSQLPDLPENYSIITLTLEPQADGTLVRFRQQNLPTESIYKHVDFAWGGLLVRLKRLVEEQAGA